MPKKILVKCFDEKGIELLGWRWDAESKSLYHYKTIDRHDMRFSTGVKCEPILDEEQSKEQKKPYPQLLQLTINKAVREANAEITRRIKAEQGEINNQPLIREVTAKLLKIYEARPCASGKKNHTLNGVRNAFSKLDEYWGTLFPSQISSDEWSKFQDWWDIHYPGYNSFNVTKYMRVIRNHCIEIGLLKLKPKIVDRNKKAQRIKRNKKKDWVYSDQEILDLDEACETDFERIVVRLGYQNAFRISDALSVEWSQFILNGKVPVYKFQGGDKAETYVGAPLTKDVVDLVKNYPKTESRYLFPLKNNPDRPLNQQQFDFEVIKARAEVTRGTFHALRHYRLSKDFKNPKFTTIQVCVLRRVSLRQAFDDYVHADEKDLELLQNAGALATIRGLKNE